MRVWFFRLLARLTGRNFSFTPKSAIVLQLNESRPLPLGRRDFEEWSDRIIRGAMVPSEDGYTVGGSLPISLTDKDRSERVIEKLAIFEEGQKFALANMLLHLGPTESHKPDGHFIHTLRKVAVNQIAHQMVLEIKASQAARAAAKKKAEEEEAESDEPLHLVTAQDCASPPN